MPDYLPIDLLILGCCALLAGLVDAVSGGGGMIQVPALFSLLPGMPPATLLSINKLASLIGTTGSALQYAKTVKTPWKLVGIAASFAFLASIAGSYLVTQIPNAWLRSALPFMLLALLIFNLLSKSGLTHQPKHTHHKQTIIASAGAGSIGFYDGFLGPGAGAFYKLYFTRVMGFDFMNSAAPSKFMNIASNLGALIVFIYLGFMNWQLGLFMAAANYIGGQIGSRLAIKHGNSFIRNAFLVSVSVLIIKTFYDAYLK